MTDKQVKYWRSEFKLKIVIRVWCKSLIVISKQGIDLMMIYTYACHFQPLQITLKSIKGSMNLLNLEWQLSVVIFLPKLCPLWFVFPDLFSPNFFAPAFFQFLPPRLGQWHSLSPMGWVATAEYSEQYGGCEPITINSIRPRTAPPKLDILTNSGLFLTCRYDFNVCVCLCV